MQFVLQRSTFLSNIYPHATTQPVPGEQQIVLILRNDADVGDDDDDADDNVHDVTSDHSLAKHIIIWHNVP